MSQNHIVGLDIGTSSLKAVIAEIKKDGQLSLVKVLQFPSAGMKKGNADDLPDLVRSLNQILPEIKNVSKKSLKNIFLNVCNSDARIQSSRGIVAVSRADFEIHKDDIDRVVQASQAINLPPNRMVLHSITKEFTVDDVEGIRDPLGMVGNRLEVDSSVIDVFAPKVKDLTKSVEMAGAGIGGLIFSPLADARSVLSRNQKDLGVVLIDIGFGTTTMCVYEENRLIHIAVLPIGAGNITNDLAIGLRTEVGTAEMIKLSFGSAISKGISARDTVDVRKIDPNSAVSTSRKFIAEIIEERLAEIFEFVNNELKSIDKNSKLPAGAVLVGGGAKIPGITELARQELHLSTKLGIPDTSQIEVTSGELNVQVENPEFACALGLVLWAYDRMAEDSTGVDIKSFWGKIKSSLLP
ncbi:MAG: cell division protein FtsA [Candidatus Pacebacteria bacterium]|nr:cell division protein FtsA [Candidatus Paceibacterota bacterium]